MRGIWDMRVKVLAGMLVTFGVIIALWQFLAPVVNDRFFYATFTQTVKSFPSLFTPYFGHPNSFPNYPTGIISPLKVTLYEILVAFVVASVVGVSVGLLLGYFKFIGDALEPIVYVLYSIPGAILYPVFFLTLGINSLSRIAIAIYLAVVPPIIVVASGIRRTKQTHIRLAKSFGAGNAQIFAKVIIPSAAGSIMAGIRLALVFSIIGVIFAEVIASANGLGSVISIAEGSYFPGITFGVISIITMMVAGIIGVLTVLERVILPYEH